MVKLTINDKEIEVQAGTTIIEACKKVNVEIPVFCYHKKLKVAGNCRMCLVEVEKSPKPVASCATLVAENMVVHTDSEMVHKARKGVLELLLINHPLDCPICDQGGECDLQDITMRYGSSSSRFDFYKRAVVNKYMGPFIKTIMNRCIHCTRCVRFANEVAGVEEIGTNHRGENTEIISYLDKAISSELSGNMIDICPVGALTNKPYAFHGRPWELEHFPSIDITDAIGSNISLDVKNNEILRITPIKNDAINEDWISDKVRFFYDGLKIQRLNNVYIRKNNKLQIDTFENALEIIADKLKETSAQNIGFLSGDLVDFESNKLFYQIAKNLNINNIDFRTNGAMFEHDDISHYSFLTSLEEIDQDVDLILLIGTNPKTEASILNARIRKNVFHRNIKAGLIGNKVDLNYNYEFLGDSLSTLNDLINDKHSFIDDIKRAKKPIIILGTACFKISVKEFVKNAINILSQKYNIDVNVLHISASAMGALQAGIIPYAINNKYGFDANEILEKQKQSEIQLLYLLNSDVNYEKDKSFVIYQGHHADFAAQNADIILPSSSFAEKKATYINTFGLKQHTIKAIHVDDKIKDDQEILNLLAKKLNISISYEQSENDQSVQQIKFTPFNVDKNKITDDLNLKFDVMINNYYQHDIISKHSVNMANAVNEIVRGNRGAI